ncbi:MAG: hypothetical protein L0H79_04745 [Intrasporangium sp.]|uniref:hypothetical protein n=1 Tax=Intrasporangium sp. TaxID=1925024 RepID=UPI0026495EFE|nr:hypothetical protein [Intrasporangium sp.]MDN5795042.1 hypothetical protein [Intrasporangium sp.]
MSPADTSPSGRRGRALRRLAVVVATVVITGAFASASSDAHSRNDSLDLTSIAISSSAQPQVRDDAFDTERLRGRTVDAETSSAANAECDGCTATATTLGVVYVDRGRATKLDNVATAWNSCKDCRTASVSVQVVVVRRAQKVTANNRALALNAACEGCQASAAAYQIVMLEPKGKRLSGRDVAALRDWVDAQAAAMSAAPAPRSMLRSAPGAPGAPLDQLEDRVGFALGGAKTLDRSADVQTG